MGSVAKRRFAFCVYTFCIFAPAALAKDHGVKEHLWGENGIVGPENDKFLSENHLTNGQDQDSNHGNLLGRLPREITNDSQSALATSKPEVVNKTTMIPSNDTSKQTEAIPTRIATMKEQTEAIPTRIATMTMKANTSTEGSAKNDTMKSDNRVLKLTAQDSNDTVKTILAEATVKAKNHTERANSTTNTQTVAGRNETKSMSKEGVVEEARNSTEKRNNATETQTVQGRNEARNATEENAVTEATNDTEIGNNTIETQTVQGRNETGNMTNENMVTEATNDTEFEGNNNTETQTSQGRNETRNVTEENAVTEATNDTEIGNNTIETQTLQGRNETGNMTKENMVTEATNDTELEGNNNTETQTLQGRNETRNVTEENTVTEATNDTETGNNTIETQTVQGRNETGNMTKENMVTEATNDTEKENNTTETQTVQGRNEARNLTEENTVTEAPNDTELEGNNTTHTQTLQGRNETRNVTEENTVTEATNDTDKFNETFKEQTIDDRDETGNAIKENPAVTEAKEIAENPTVNMTVQSKISTDKTTENLKNVSGKRTNTIMQPTKQTINSTANMATMAATESVQDGKAAINSTAKTRIQPMNSTENITKAGNMTAQTMNDSSLDKEATNYTARPTEQTSSTEEIRKTENAAMKSANGTVTIAEGMSPTVKPVTRETNRTNTIPTELHTVSIEEVISSNASVKPTTQAKSGKLTLNDKMNVEKTQNAAVKSNELTALANKTEAVETDLRNETVKITSSEQTTLSVKNKKEKGNGTKDKISEESEKVTVTVAEKTTVKPASKAVLETTPTGIPTTRVSKDNTVTKTEAEKGTEHNNTTTKSVGKGKEVSAKKSTLKPFTKDIGNIGRTTVAAKPTKAVEKQTETTVIKTIVEYDRKATSKALLKPTKKAKKKTKATEKVNVLIPTLKTTKPTARKPPTRKPTTPAATRDKKTTALSSSSNVKATKVTTANPLTQRKTAPTKKKKNGAHRKKNHKTRPITAARKHTSETKATGKPKTNDDIGTAKNSKDAKKPSTKKASVTTQRITTVNPTTTTASETAKKTTTLKATTEKVWKSSHKQVIQETEYDTPAPDVRKIGDESKPGKGVYTADIIIAATSVITVVILLAGYRYKHKIILFIKEGRRQKPVYKMPAYRQKQVKIEESVPLMAERDTNSQHYFIV